MIELAAALMIGLAGSLHCVGMCGPLALALPRSRGNRMTQLAGRLAYNLGRAVTYAAMGALFGLAGQSLLLAGWQRALSLAVGILILAYVLLRATGRRWSPDVLLAGALYPLQKALARLLHQPGLGSLGLIGLLNGLLPCGLVYVALAGAAATGSAARGALFMAVFGLGTVPLMLAVSLVGPALHSALRGKMQRAVPLSLAVLAMLFILRGLELGIPYVSPNLTAQVEEGAAPACCRH